MKTAKRALALLLSLMLVLGTAAAGGVSVSALSGSGTADDPYQIESYSDLKEFADIVNGENGKTQNPSACAVLTQDITAEGSDWIPIANSEDYPFTGTFDGQGYKIIGLNNSESSSKDESGLFGFIGEGGAVQNTALENASFTGIYIGGIAHENNGTIISCSFGGSINCSGFAGGIAGSNLSAGTITECYNTGSVSGKNDVGGIAGSNNGTVESCYNTGSASATGDGSSAGGILGYNANVGKVTNCYNTGNATGNGDYSSVGGITGYMETNNPEWVTEITNCYSAGSVTSTGENAYAGGVLGYLDSGTITNCYYDNEKCSAAGAIDGADDETNSVKGLPTEEMTGTDALSNLAGFSADNWTAVENDYPVLKWQLPGGAPAQTVYEISSYADLVAFALVINGNEEEEIEPNPSATAVLTQNIYATYDPFEGPEWASEEDIDYAKDWVPIAKSSGCAFTGTFDGQGYKIIGLNNSESEGDDKNESGLFGFIGEGGVVQNTALERADFNAWDDSSGEFVGSNCGGIAHENNGTIISCSFDGSITCSLGAGGIAGINYGTITECYNNGSISGEDLVGGIAGDNNGTITECYNTGTVTGNYGAGGIAGNNGSDNGTITECYNTGSVTGNIAAGGIAGSNMNSGKVSDCYNTGSITGNNSVGGIAGKLETNNPAWVTEITNCYSAGSVTATGENADAGGVVGYLGGNCTVKNCYYDNEKCSAAGAVDGADDETNSVKGLPTEEMTGTDALTNLVGFSADNWTAVENSYPVLKWQLPGGTPSQTVYEISSYADLVAFAQVVNGTDGVDPDPSVSAVLTADIEATDSRWVPIAKSSGCAFTGTFDGQGYKITGLNNSQSSSKNNSGLFGIIGEGGVVQNTALENASLTGSNIGGIAYENRGAIISCSFDGSITGNGIAGGIACYNYGTITGCFCTGSVSGDGPVGGIAGDNYGTITGCYNTGSVSGTGDSIGGIAGINSDNGTITECYNTGSVTGNNYYVGGINGINMNGGEVTNCYNTGSITGNYEVGGIAGYMQTNNPEWVTEITNCYSAGSVTATGENAYAGGVLGYNNSGTVENCYYDNENCALAKAVGNTDDTENVKGLETALMTGLDALRNLTGFSSAVWLEQEYVYPMLRSVPDNSQGYIIAGSGVHYGEDVSITVYIPGDRTDEDWVFDFTVRDSEGIVMTGTKGTDSFDADSGLTCSEPWEVSGLDAGDYTVSAAARDGEQTAGVIIVPAAFTILPVETEITIDSIDPVFVSDKAVITLSVSPSEAARNDGDVVVYIDGAGYTPEEVDGVLTVTVPCIYYSGQEFSAEAKKLEAGNYLVRAEFKGGKNYAPSETADVLTVAKRQPSIVIDTEGVLVEGEVNEINITATGIPEGAELMALADGERIDIDENMQIHKEFAIGEHTLYIYYPGDRNREYCAAAMLFKYKPSFGNRVITVSVSDTTSDGHAVATVYAKELYGSFRDVELTVKNSAGETVLEKTVQLGDYDSTEGYALATADLGTLTPGSYTVEAFYRADNGSAGQIEGYTASSAFTVRESTSLSIDAPQNLTFGDDAVIGFDFLSPGATGEIKAFVDGTQYTVSVDEPSLTLSGLEAGSHLVYACYEGDGTHAPAEAAAVFDIEKADVTLDVELDPVIREGENQKIKVSLSDVSATGSVTVAIGAEKYDVTLTNGVAVLPVAVPQKGRHIVTIYYPGDNNHSAAFASTEFTVEAARGANLHTSASGVTLNGSAPAATVLSIKPVAPVTYGEDAVVELVLSDPTATGTITVTINGYEYVTDTEHLTLTVPTDDKHGVTGGGDLKPGMKNYITNYPNDFDTSYFAVPYSPYEPDGCLNAGGYLVTAEYEGDETHASAKAYEVLTVNKRQHTIGVEITEENGSVIAQINTASDNPISVYINGIVYPVNEDKQVLISKLAPGTYTLIAVSGDLYNAGEFGYEGFCHTASANDEIAVTAVTFTVPESGMTVSAPDIQLGEQTQVTVSLPETVYSVESYGNPVSVTVRDSGGNEVFSEDITQLALNSATGMWEATVNYTPEETGVHTAYATYINEGGENTVSGTFNVYETETAITITKPEKVAAGEDAEITVSLSPAGATGDVTVYVDGTPYTPDASGKVTVPALAVGGHLIKAVYEGDGKFAPARAYDVLAAEKEEQTIKLDVEDIMFGDSVEIIATLSSPTASGNVTILINNEDYSRELADGYVLFEVEDLPVGKYIASAYYPGDKNHSAAFAIDEFTVNKVYPEISISDIEAAYGDTVDVTVTIEGGNATGTITVDGEEYEVENGQATFPFTPTSAGVQAIEVEYSGDENYESGTETTEFDVAKAVPEMTLSVSPTNPAEGEAVKVTAELAPEGVTGKVIFSIDGTGYTAQIKDGKAELAVSGLSSGKKVITADYPGDDNYESNSAEIEITINGTREMDVVADDIYDNETEIITIYVPDEKYIDVSVSVLDSSGETITGGTVSLDHYFSIYNYTGGTWEIPYSFEPGVYTVNAEYIEQEEGYTVTYTGTTTFTVLSRLDPDISLAAGNINFGETATAAAALPEDATGIVTFCLNGADTGTKVDVANGKASCEFKGLEPGTHTVEATYSGDNKYESKTVETTFTVATVPCLLTINYKYADGSEAATAYSGEVNYGENYSVESPAVTGYTPDPAVVAGTMKNLDGVEVNVTYTANTYTAFWVIDSEEYTQTQSTFGQPVNQPRTPSKEGYTFKWVDEIPETMPAENITINGTFTIIKYTATFVREDGTEFETREYDVETTSIDEPAVPEKEGYTGEWEDYTLTIGGITVKPVYTANTYKLTWLVDGENFKNETVTFGSNITAPPVSEKEGYTFEWTDAIPETMPAEDITINGKYTAITYKATFVDENGDMVKEIKYTVETESITPPAVPEKQGYTGKWEDYELKIGGITVKPVYTEIPHENEPTVSIDDFEPESEIGYKEDVVYRASTDDLPEGAEIHWFVDGEDVGTGEGLKVEDPTEDYTVQAKVIDKDGNVLAESETQKVHVKNGFFDRLKAFFAELIEKILGKAIIDILTSIC
ncbi:MAG: Ig-like domain repeat protein [Clostridia bacterium]|nr:Ig-like domain repeat protein [Clostridia bacterium]